MRDRLLRALHSLALGRFPGRLIRAPLAPSLASTRELPVRIADRRVDVYTFVTDEREYAGMLESFDRAGFSVHASFHRLSDRDTDPFAAVGAVGAVGAPQGGAAYAVLCHQDIRFAPGFSAERWFTVLEALERSDPAWTVAGAAGVDRRLEVVRAVVDAAGAHSSHRLPVRIMSLDELFLVLNRRNRPHCSPQLHGFHFYGTDVCLTAITQGGSAWVIDVPLLHGLARAPRTGADEARYWADYHAARQRFIGVWAPRFRFRYVGITSEVLPLGRWAVVVALLGAPRILRWVTIDRDISRLTWWTAQSPVRD